MNIAIFGGSFDPPHIGHEEITYQVLDIVDVDKLIIVPTYLNPFKNKFYLEPFERFELLDSLFDSDKIEISKFEINQNRAVPSIETIEHFKRIYTPHNIYLIIGADNLKSIHLWNNFEKLNKLVKFIVISRDGYEVKDDIIQFINIKMNIKISSSTLRENFDLKYIPKKIQQKVKQLWKKESKEL